MRPVVYDGYQMIYKPPYFNFNSKMGNYKKCEIEGSYLKRIKDSLKNPRQIIGDIILELHGTPREDEDDFLINED